MRDSSLGLTVPPPTKMVEEKEIRFKVNTSSEELCKALEKTGLSNPRVLYIRDVYYDDENYSLLKNLEGYRMREVVVKEGKKIYFVYKKKRDGKVYEQEVEASQFKEKILNFKNEIKIRKKRVIYTINDVEVVIDDVPGLGVFLEIECQGSDPQKFFDTIKNKLNGVERIYQGITELWFEKELTGHN